jgi:glutaryl-CoA dehydrogenase
MLQKTASPAKQDEDNFSELIALAKDFRWDDPLLIDAQLTDDERMIRDTARDYAQSALMPRILKAHRDETFDIAVMKELGEMGFLGAPIPGYGCAGVSYVAYGLVCRELERVDTAFRSACGVQTTLSMLPMALRPNVRNTFPPWPRANCLAASGSPSPTTAQTRVP